MRAHCRGVATGSVATSSPDIAASCAAPGAPVVADRLLGSRSGRWRPRRSGSAGRTPVAALRPDRSSRSSRARRCRRVVGLYTHSRVLLSERSCTCTFGECHFQRPSCGRPHMLRVSTPPNCWRPAVMAPSVPVRSRGRGIPTETRRSGTGPGGRWPSPSPRTHPGRRRRCRGRRAPAPCWRPASSAARSPGTSPTACCRPAPSWCTCSTHRLRVRRSRCPCPPRVAIALPAVTQLLTSGAALNASSRTTACGPPPENATGISRPIAADGTISISTSALAVGAMDVPAPQSPAASTTVRIVRITPRINCPISRSSSLPPREKSITPARRGAAKMTDGGDPEGSPPPTMFVVSVVSDERVN